MWRAGQFFFVAPGLERKQTALWRKSRLILFPRRLERIWSHKRFLSRAGKRERVWFGDQQRCTLCLLDKQLFNKLTLRQGLIEHPSWLIAFFLRNTGTLECQVAHPIAETAGRCGEICPSHSQEAYVVEKSSLSPFFWNNFSNSLFLTAFMTLCI